MCQDKFSYRQYTFVIGRGKRWLTFPPTVWLDNQSRDEWYQIKTCFLIPYSYFITKTQKGLSMKLQIELEYSLFFVDF